MDKAQGFLQFLEIYVLKGRQHIALANILDKQTNQQQATQGTSK